MFVIQHHENNVRIVSLWMLHCVHLPRNTTTFPALPLLYPLSLHKNSTACGFTYPKHYRLVRNLKNVCSKTATFICKLCSYYVIQIKLWWYAGRKREIERERKKKEREREREKTITLVCYMQRIILEIVPVHIFVLSTRVYA